MHGEIGVEEVCEMDAVRLGRQPQLVRVRLSEIDPNPRQPRRAFPPESIDALAEGVKEGVETLAGDLE